jgi:hypothetical protein
MSYHLEILLFKNNNVISSGNTIVKNKNWEFVKNNSTEINSKEKILYHLTTSNNEIIINNQIYTDYEQVYCEDIDNFTIKSLNSSSRPLRIGR